MLQLKSLFTWPMVCLAVGSAAFADTGAASPGQALARIRDGRLELCLKVSEFIPMTQTGQRMVPYQVTETVKELQTVTENGVERQVEVPRQVTVQKQKTEMFTYIVMQSVWKTTVQSFPASTGGFRREADGSSIVLFDLAGNRLSVQAVESRLTDWTLVLTSATGDALDREYAPVFRPTTIVVGLPPFKFAPTMPASAPVMPSPSSQPVPPTSQILPGVTTVPVVALAPEEAPKLPDGPVPTFAYARVWGEKTLALRTEEEKTMTETCPVMTQVDRVHEGKTVKVNVCVPKSLEKTIRTQVTTKYPLEDVSVTKVPSSTVERVQIPRVLGSDQLVAVSANGQAVDPLWLRNLRDGVFVVVVPTSPVGMAAPMMAPMAMPPQPVIPAPAGNAPQPVAPAPN
jgi:hypothetical protein